MENQIAIIESGVSVHSAIGNLFERFAKYIDVKDVTQKSYCVCLRCFADWLACNGIQAPQRADILRYVHFLAEPHASRRGQQNAPKDIVFSAGTQARYLRAVKMFFKWTASENLYPNIAENIKGAKVRADNSKRDALEKTDARKLLESIDRDTIAGKRDYAMILLSITAGLRIIEMQRANIGDIETIAGEKVLFVQGKGHDEKDAYKKITPEVFSAIDCYLRERKSAGATDALFAGIGNRSAGQRIAETSISRIIKNRLRDAGYNTHRLSAHSLRHTSVTFLLESGATLQEAQAHARHAAPETTEIYAHNIDQKRAHTEQRIYDFMFDKAKDPTEAAADCFRRMNATQQARALELLQALAG